MKTKSELHKEGLQVVINQPDRVWSIPVAAAACYEAGYEQAKKDLLAQLETPERHGRKALSNIREARGQHLTYSCARFLQTS